MDRSRALLVLRGMPGTLVAWVWMAGVLVRSMFVRRRPPAGRLMMIVAWGFPPLASVGVHVIASVAREAVRSGWRVCVVCGPQPGEVTEAGEELLQGVPPEVKIVRVRSWMMNDRGARLTPSPGLLPALDGGYLTAWACLGAALPLLRQELPAVVVGTGPRFSNFVAARWIADLSHCPLVLHYRDEWTVNTPDFVHCGAYERDTERACLQRADLVLFASQSKLDAYTDAFSDVSSDKYAVMMNGWDPHFHSAPLPGVGGILGPDDRFTLLYAGRWHRNVQPLLDDLGLLLRQHPDLAARLRFVIVGTQTDDNARRMALFQAHWPGIMALVPQVSLRMAVALTQAASALLLINDHIYDGVIPQKTYDYMASRRPILVYGQTGGAKPIVEDSHAGVCVAVSDPRALHQALTCFITVPPDQWNGVRRQAWVRANNRSDLIREALVRIDTLSRLPRYRPATDKAAVAG